MITTKTIIIQATGFQKGDRRYQDHMDFIVDNISYRYVPSESRFYKLYPCWGGHGKAIRGNARKLILAQVTDMFKHEIKIGIIQY